jgi:hypothetical protein
MRSRHTPYDRRGDAVAAQLFDTVTASPSEIPERRLMAAVLFDAVLHLSRRGSKGAAEAMRWIHAGNDENTPFSFTSVCEALGLNSEYLARGLLKWDPDADDRGVPDRRSLSAHGPRRVALPARRRRRPAALTG